MLYALEMTTICHTDCRGGSGLRLSAGEQPLPLMLTILDEGKEEISSPPRERSPLNVRQGGAGYLW